MSGVQSVGATVRVTIASSSAAGPAPASLLPDASPISAGGLTDAMSALYMSISQMSQNSAATSASQVASDQQASQKALLQEQADEKRAQANEANQGRGFFSSIGHLVSDVTHDATHLKVVQAVKDTVNDSEQAWNSPSFWNDLEKGALVVAKVAAAVGSAVVTGASFGAGAVTLAGVALLMSVGGEVVSDTQCFGKASSMVALGLDIGSVAAGGIGAATSTGEAATAMAIGVSFKAAGGGAEMVQGAAHIKTQQFAANVVDASADAQHDVNQSQQMDQLVGWVLDQMKASDKASRTLLQSVQGVIQTSDQSNAAAAASVSVKG